jgi:hypothetical protein
MPPKGERNKLNDTSLWDDKRRYPVCFGCLPCHEFTICGGLHIRSALIDCSDLCQCTPEQRDRCELVCPKNPEKFAARYREVNGWKLDAGPMPSRVVPAISGMIPILKDGACRRRPYTDTAGVAVRLDRIFNITTGELRWNSRETIDKRLKLDPKTPLVINSIGFDDPLERYWDRGRRNGIASAIASLRPALMTTPNFSLFTDVPRHENLYNMKRIVICWEELVRAGVTTAIHLNGRTDQDWTRWAKFVSQHPEIASVAFEFTTGGAGARGKWYVEHLLRLADTVGRDLTLLVRGGTRHLHTLQRSYRNVAFLYAKPYVATMNRQRFEWRAPSALIWHSDPTPRGQPLDDLFEHNVKVARQMVHHRMVG